MAEIQHNLQKYTYTLAIQLLYFIEAFHRAWYRVWEDLAFFFSSTPVVATLSKRVLDAFTYTISSLGKNLSLRPGKSVQAAIFPLPFFRLK